MMLAGTSFVLAVSRWPAGAPVTVLLGLFAIYSAVALSWRSLEAMGRPWLALLVDTLVFLLSAFVTAEQNLWFSSLFYVYLLIAAALLHGWREVWIVVVISMAFFLFTKPSHTQSLMPMLALAGILACALALEKRSLVEKLTGASRESEQFQSEAHRAREGERQRIANDFHDGPLQSYISLQMRLEFLKKMMERKPEAAPQELHDIQELLASQVTDLRTWLRGMRPIQMEGNFPAAVRRLVDEFKKDSGISTSVLCGEIKETGEPETSIELLQIVREALTNVQKHSRASRVNVSVERVGPWLEVSVEDDGTGFPFAGAFTLDELETLGLGPMSIRRRVRTLGGDLVVESKPERGAGIKVRVPA
jgi:signal transduction histidine kinase